MKLAIIGSRGLGAVDIGAHLPDGVLAFWDGRSRGTARTVDLFRAAGKPVQVILVNAKASR